MKVEVRRIGLDVALRENGLEKGWTILVSLILVLNGELAGLCHHRLTHFLGERALQELEQLVRVLIGSVLLTKVVRDSRVSNILEREHSVLGDEILVGWIRRVLVADGENACPPRLGRSRLDVVEEQRQTCRATIKKRLERSDGGLVELDSGRG